MSTVIDAPEVKSALPDNIKRLLSDRGQSAYWLMKQIGMTEGSFYPIIRGEVVPSVLIASRIAEVLETTVDELLKKLSRNSRKARKTA